MKSSMMTLSKNPLICAIDTTDVATAQQLALQVKPHMGAIKLGLEFFTAHGAAGVQQVVPAELPLFLDLKFHDIPNTVAKAIRATAAMNVFMLTVHSAGGKEMLQAAACAAEQLAEETGRTKPLVVAVTLLTSLDQHNLTQIGVSHPLQEQVLRLADLAQQSGLDGVVCSAHEIALLRAQCGKDFTLVVPGIRPEGSAVSDQKRVMTPAEAQQQGADYLVIGRPITEAPSPADAAQKIYQSLPIPFVV
jgi:orotidine-5'-phosphate decarboxylase